MATHSDPFPPPAWPTHARDGRIDWWTCLDRGDLRPFKTALSAQPAVVDAPFDGSDRTALMSAVGSTPELVCLLLQAGADPNRRDAEARPVWDFAPTWGPGATEIWKALLEAGLDVHASAPDGATPLLRVCSGYTDPATERPWIASRVAIVDLILAAGGDPNAADRYGTTPMQAARRGNNGYLLGRLRRAGAVERD